MSASVGIPATTARAPVAFDEDDTRVSGRRFVAHFVDGLIYAVVVLLFIFGASLLAQPLGEDVGAVVIIAALVFAFTIGHAWFLVLIHGSTGRSPGKHAVGIRVVDANGEPPSRGAMWKRSIPIVIEYFYVIAWVGMMASPYRQRFGDRWGKTYVIRG